MTEFFVDFSDFRRIFEEFSFFSKFFSLCQIILLVILIQFFTLFQMPFSDFQYLSAEKKSIFYSTQKWYFFVPKKIFFGFTIFVAYLFNIYIKTKYTAWILSILHEKRVKRTNSAISSDDVIDDVIIYRFLRFFTNFFHYAK